MQIPSPLCSPRRLWRLALVVLLPAALLRAAEDDPVAVFAQVFNGYQRTRLPDKSFKPEAYVFGEGGCWTRPVKDVSMEEMTFLKVAKAVAQPLGRLNYRPARTSAEAELLILVYWGSTQGSSGQDSTDASNRLSQASSTFNATKPVGPPTNEVDPVHSAAQGEYATALWMLAQANEVRDEIDARNARILGYSEVLDRAKFAAHMSFAQDIMTDVANNRYYVVLQAYDFKTAATEKKLKPLWTARISMDESGNDFTQSLDRMLRSAARYFGQDSNGLHRDAGHETRVDLGPLEIIETLPPETLPKK
jgi:hypothetical protein